MGMTNENPSPADLELAAAGVEYRNAHEALRAAKARADRATRAAKHAGISQYEIVRVMGDAWAKENNPQYPPAL